MIQVTKTRVLDWNPGEKLLNKSWKKKVTKLRKQIGKKEASLSGQHVVTITNNQW